LVTENVRKQFKKKFKYFENCIVYRKCVYTVICFKITPKTKIGFCQKPILRDNSSF